MFLCIPGLFKFEYWYGTIVPFHLERRCLILYISPAVWQIHLVDMNVQFLTSKLSNDYVLFDKKMTTIVLVLSSQVMRLLLPLLVLVPVKKPTTERLQKYYIDDRLIKAWFRSNVVDDCGTMFYSFSRILTQSQFTFSWFPSCWATLLTESVVPRRSRSFVCLVADS